MVALGGNAIAGPGLSVDYDSMAQAISRAASLIARALSGSSVRLVITHGNGPQVGFLAEALEHSGSYIPLYLLTAMTQAWIGSMIKRFFERSFSEAGSPRRVEVVVTHVLVEASEAPIKPIGRVYSAEEIAKLERERGWRFSKDPRGGYRRVVPSPKPLRVLEADVIRALLDRGFDVIACGGGGVPVSGLEGRYEFVEGVVDKDLCSSKLAVELGADRLVILTDVRGVALDYGGPRERWLSKLTVSEAEDLLKAGVFPEGSMGPKVEAAVEYVKATGKKAVIGSLLEAEKVLSLRAGTVIEP